MKKFLAILLAGVMALSLVACGNSADKATTTAAADSSSDLEYVMGKGTLVIGITDFAPMDYKEEGGSEWIGFDADLARAFAESIGCKAEFIEIDWDAKTMELQNKNIDLVWNGMTITEELKTSMNISNPYCNNAQVIVVSNDKAASISSIEDVKDLQFAVEAGSAGEQAAVDGELKFTSVQTQSSAVMEVAAGTADACIIDSLMAAAMVGEGTSYPNLSYTIGLTEEFYGVGGRLNSDLIDALNAYLTTAYADGTVQKLAETYKIQASLIAQ